MDAGAEAWDSCWTRAPSPTTSAMITGRPGPTCATRWSIPVRDPGFLQARTRASCAIRVPRTPGSPATRSPACWSRSSPGTWTRHSSTGSPAFSPGAPARTVPSAWLRS
ncbi:unnamed protein product [Gulo gulo]|uniref:Uncharacterized protein n=1 Tax=Gulo gulo TaxID=48420 RepID=A0A9X9LFR6_GULGU|nr:unnamed protein product [Gulo gulo]